MSICLYIYIYVHVHIYIYINLVQSYAQCPLHRLASFSADGLYTKAIRAHTQNDPREGLSERARARSHYGPMCATLVAVEK